MKDEIMFQGKVYIRDTGNKFQLFVYEKTKKFPELRFLLGNTTPLTSNDPDIVQAEKEGFEPMASWSAISCNNVYELVFIKNTPDHSIECHYIQPEYIGYIEQIVEAFEESASLRESA